MQQKNLQQNLQQLQQLQKELNHNRTHNKILYYNTGSIIHKKQLAFAQSPHRNRWVFGGNRSGKTECGAVETVWLARGIHLYRPNRADCNGWVVSLSNAMSRDITQQKILSYLHPDWIQSVVMMSGRQSSPQNGIIDFINVKNVTGGISRIGFKSCEMGRDKFQGTSLDFVWFDEEPPKDIYEECKMRVFDKCGDIYGTMTPLLGLTWVYDQIFLNAQNDPQIWHINMEWADNPYLDPAELQTLTATMTDAELQSRRYGKFRTTSGLVYPEFDQSIHCIDPFSVPKEWYNNLSIDPGLNNPLSCHFYAVDGDGKVFVIAEHYQAQQDITYHANAIQTLATQLGWHKNHSGHLEALIDSAATQRTLASQKSVTELFYQHGIAVNPKVNKDLYSGINRVKRYLQINPQTNQPQLYIFKNCTHLIRELKGYWWGNGDIPQKRDDHALDELRYFLMSLPQASPMSHKPPTPPKSLIQKHKEKLIQRRKNYT